MTLALYRERRGPRLQPPRPGLRRLDGEREHRAIMTRGESGRQLGGPGTLLARSQDPRLHGADPLGLGERSPTARLLALERAGAGVERDGIGRAVVDGEREWLTWSVAGAIRRHLHATGAGG